MDTLSTGKCWALFATAFHCALYIPRLVWSTISDLTLGDVFKLLVFWPFCAWVAYSLIILFGGRNLLVVPTWYDSLFSGILQTGEVVYSYASTTGKVAALEAHWKKCNDHIGRDQTFFTLLGFLGLKDCA